MLSPKVSGNCPVSGLPVSGFRGSRVSPLCWVTSPVAIATLSDHHAARRNVRGRGHRLGADGAREFMTLQHQAENRAARLQRPAGTEAGQGNGLIADAVDKLRDCRKALRAVACHACGSSACPPRRSCVLFQLVIADVVERLDDRRAGQLARNNLAAPGAALEILEEPVAGGPVVHRVDDELAGEDRRVQPEESVQRDREHYNVRAGGRVRRAQGLGARDQQLGDQRQVSRVAGRCDRYRVARPDREARYDGSDMTRSEYSDARHSRRCNLHAAYPFAGTSAASQAQAASLGEATSNIEVFLLTCTSWPAQPNSQPSACPSSASAVTRHLPAHSASSVSAGTR